MAVTIRDVARLAGCSIKTVSRVINGEPYVTVETRTRVQSAIRAVGYAPNISARRLAQNKSFLICLLMYPGFTQAGSELLTRVMDVSYEENYDILIQPYFPAHVRSKRKLVSLIYEHRIDGFITTPPLDADDFVADMLVTYKVPHVRVSPLRRSEDIPFVAGSDRAGARAMTAFLIGLGHRRIAFLSGPRNMGASQERAAGYFDALHEHGIADDPALLCSSEWTFDGGYTMTKQLLALEDSPSAIFAGHDEAALGALYAAQELGQKVPEQLSVCGYDDMAVARQVFPGLTTVHQPSDELVEMAARLLIGRLKGSMDQPLHSLVTPQVVARGSTGPCPRP